MGSGPALRGRFEAAQALIRPAQRTPVCLSFWNLVEVYVLASMRRAHGVSMPRVRRALAYVAAHRSLDRPLIEQDFLTDGVDLFVEEYAKLVNVSQAGQAAIREALSSSLQRIERDAKGLATRMFPWRHKATDPLDVEMTRDGASGSPCSRARGCRRACSPSGSSRETPSTRSPGTTTCRARRWRPRSGGRVRRPPSTEPRRLRGPVSRSRRRRESLRARGVRVEIHDDHFAVDCEDEEWLPEVGARGWIALTKDQHIRRRPRERRALEDAGVAAFVLTAGAMTGPEMAEAFGKAIERIRRTVASHTRPLIGLVNRGGGVQVLVGERRGGVRKG